MVRISEKDDMWYGLHCISYQQPATVEIPTVGYAVFAHILFVLIPTVL